MQSSQNSSNSFFDLIHNVYTSLQICDFEEALAKCTQYEQMNADEKLQIKSLRAYILINLEKVQQANTLLEECLLVKPLHLPSLKRKASLLQKMGNHEQAKEKLTFTLYLEPESRSLKNKLKKLKMKNNNSSAKSQDSSDSKESNKEIQKKEKPGVKFGSFQVIDIATEDSDEHFAIIKEQINKMSTKKPKKSILKEPMSASFFSQKKKKNYSQKSQKNEEQFQETIKKEENVWNSTKIQFKVKGNEGEILKKKKKCKSVSFGDNVQLDEVQ